MKKRVGRIVPHEDIGGIYGGTYLKNNPRVLEAMQSCGLDWETRICEVGLRDKFRTVIPKRFATYRTAGPGKNIPFDVVKTRYRPVHNRQSFACIDSILDGELQASIVAGGMIRDGVKVWIAVDLGSFEPVPGDVVRKILVVMNSNDGSSNLTFHMIPVRETSQVMMNFHDTGGFYRVPHNSGAITKLSEVERIMKIGMKLLTDFEDKCKLMAQQVLSEAEMNGVVLSALGVTKKEFESWQKKPGKQPQWVNQYRVIMEMLETGPGNSYGKGTLWAALNAIQGFQDLIRTVRGSQKDASNLYESKMVGHSAKAKLLGFSECVRRLGLAKQK